MEKKKLNSRLKAENLQNFRDHLRLNSERVTECFSNFFLEVFHIYKIRIIIIQIGKNLWDLESCRKI
jgi:hypothetical protein